MIRSNGHSSVISGCLFVHKWVMLLFDCVVRPFLEMSLIFEGNNVEVMEYEICFHKMAFTNAEELL